MRGPRTLRGRLSLSALAAATVFVVLLTSLFDVVLVRRLQAEATAVLRSRAAAVADTVDVAPGGRLTVADNPEDRALETGSWVYAGRALVARSAGPALLQRRADALAGTAGRQVRTQGVEYLSYPVLRQSRQVGTVVVALSLAPYDRARRTTVFGSLVLAVLVLAVFFVLTRRILIQALSPVGEMTRQAGQWSATDTSLRFGAGDRPGELAELAGTLDGLLDRLAAVLRHEERLTAEISHELRTPLAGIAAEAEVFASRPRTAEQAQQAMLRVAGGAQRMERILDGLLTAARLGSTSPRGTCDALAATREAVDGLGEQARRLGRRTEVTAHGSRLAVGVDAAVLERVLGPLLDNALRYAGSRVEVVVDDDGPWVTLTVLDDGPGVAPADADAVFEPGWRAAPPDSHNGAGDDEAGHDGAGLGLALAVRVARAAGGSLACRPGPGGAFVLRLPRA